MVIEMKRRKAFIFTLDAILAIIPVFIVLASISQINYVESLKLQSAILGDERVLQDALESMRIHGDFDVLSASSLNETISSLLGEDYGYSYSLKYNNTIILNISSGEPPEDADIVAGKRIAFIQLERILDYAVAISHGGDIRSNEYCTCGSAQHVWKLNFSYAPDSYDYWVVGERASANIGIPVFWRISAEPLDCIADNLCGGGISSGTGQNMFSGNELRARHYLTPYSNLKTTTMLPNREYYVYVRVVGSPSQYMDFFIIRSMKGESEDLITSENAKRYDNVEATLKIWRK